MGIEKHRNELKCGYNYPATVIKITYLFRTITNTEILCIGAQDSYGQKDKVLLRLSMVNLKIQTFLKKQPVSA